MMFVLKSKYDALKREAEDNERSARFVLAGYRQREDNMERELRHTQAAYRNVKQDLIEANAKLADLQKPKQDAGAQAFAAIVREAEFARHESVLAYQGHAGEGGIQRHSIGEEYPFIVYGQETQAGVRYRVLDTRNGLVYFNAFSSSRAASAFVRRCKDEDKTFTDTGFIISRSK